MATANTDGTASPQGRVEALGNAGPNWFAPRWERESSPSRVPLCPSTCQGCARCWSGLGDRRGATRGADPAHWHIEVPCSQEL